ncbi:TPA: restriction endonuclease subunit S, partial [Escherichia coli]
VQKMALNRLSNTLIPLAPSMEAAKIIDNIKKIEDISKAMLKKIQSAQQTQLHLADALTDAAIN